LLDDEQAQSWSIAGQGTDGFEAASLDAEVHESLGESVGAIESEVCGFGFVSFIGDGEVDFDGNFRQVGHGAKDESDFTEDDVAGAAIGRVHGVERG
jgi:hypothetical protein